MHQLKYLAAAPMAQWVIAQPALAQALKFDITGFSVEGNTLLTAEKITNFLSSFTGTGREMGDITKAAQVLQTFRNPDPVGIDVALFFADLLPFTELY